MDKPLPGAIKPKFESPQLELLIPIEAEFNVLVQSLLQLKKISDALQPEVGLEERVVPGTI